MNGTKDKTETITRTPGTVGPTPGTAGKTLHIRTRRTPGLPRNQPIMGTHEETGDNHNDPHERKMDDPSVTIAGKLAMYNETAEQEKLQSGTDSNQTTRTKTPTLHVEWTINLLDVTSVGID